MSNNIPGAELIDKVFPPLLRKHQHVRNLSNLQTAMGCTTTNAVSCIDGCRSQCLIERHLEVDTGQVHGHGHGEAVRVGVEIGSQRHQGGSTRPHENSLETRPPCLPM